MILFKLRANTADELLTTFYNMMNTYEVKHTGKKLNNYTQEICDFDITFHKPELNKNFITATLHKYSRIWGTVIVQIFFDKYVFVPDKGWKSNNKFTKDQISIMQDIFGTNKSIDDRIKKLKNLCYRIEVRQSAEMHVLYLFMNFDNESIRISVSFSKDMKTFNRIDIKTKKSNYTFTFSL